MLESLAGSILLWTRTWTAVVRRWACANAITRLIYAKWVAFFPVKIWVHLLGPSSLVRSDRPAKERMVWWALTPTALCFEVCVDNPIHLSGITWGISMISCLTQIPSWSWRPEILKITGTWPAGVKKNARSVGSPSTATVWESNHSTRCSGKSGVRQTNTVKP